MTIEATYGCGRFVTPLFMRAEGNTLREVESHPTSLYLPSGTLVDSEFTREALAEELKFQTATGSEFIGVDGRPLKPEGLTRFGEELVFFSGDDGQNGREPWVTDGTRQGTRLVRDIHESDSSNPELLGRTSQGMVFAATSETHGRELWVTDGSNAGTRLLRDIVSGAGGSSPQRVTVDADVLLSNTVFFWTQNNAGERELWATDGSSVGTEQIVSTFPNANFQLTTLESLSDGTTVLGFADEVGNFEIWLTDGSSQGTRQLTGLPELGVIERIQGSASEPSRLAFQTAADQIWSFNRSNEQAALVWSNSDSDRTASLNPKNITGIGDRVLFTTEEGTKSRVWLWDPVQSTTTSPGVISIGSDMTIRSLGSESAIFTQFNTVRALQGDTLSALGTQLLRQHESTGEHSYLLSSDNRLTIIDANLQVTAADEAYHHLLSTDGKLFAIRDDGAVVEFRGATPTAVSEPLFNAETQLYPRSADSLWAIQPDRIHRFDLSSGRIMLTWPLLEPVGDVAVTEGGQLIWRNRSARTLQTIRKT